MHRSGHWRKVSLSIALAACAQLAIAQDPAPQTGGGAAGGGAPAGGGVGGGTTGGGNPGGTGGFPGGNTGTGQPGRNTQPFPTDPREQQRSPFPDQMQRPIFLSGKVVLDDGTPPPDPVVIERVCNGNPRPEGYTDSKGRFSFQLGQNAHVMADASVNSASDGFGDPSASNRTGGNFGGLGRNSGISERDLVGCEIRASLPGYRSEIVNLSGRRFMDNPDVGTIILRRMANVEGLTFSATSAMAPKDAKKAYEKSRDLLKKKKIADAQKELEKAVQIYPKYANAWSDLGLVHEAQNHGDEAMKAYQQAVESDSKLVKPYVQMALLYARQNPPKWQETADLSGKALKLNPYDFPQAYFYNAVANLNLKNLDEAEKSAREGAKGDAGKKIPKIHHVLGIVLAQKNDIAGAMPHMKSYLATLPADGPETKMVKDQIAQMEKFAANQPAGEAPAAGQQQQQQQ